jgi:hypothetical protein
MNGVGRAAILVVAEAAGIDTRITSRAGSGLKSGSVRREISPALE